MKTAMATNIAAAFLLAAVAARAEAWSTNLACFHGGSYDGWDRNAMAEARDLNPPPKGTVFKFVDILLAPGRSDARADGNAIAIFAERLSRTMGPWAAAVFSRLHGDSHYLNLKRAFRRDEQDSGLVQKSGYRISSGAKVAAAPSPRSL